MCSSTRIGRGRPGRGRRSGTSRSRWGFWRWWRNGVRYRDRFSCRSFRRFDQSSGRPRHSRAPAATAPAWSRFHQEHEMTRCRGCRGRRRAGCATQTENHGDHGEMHCHRPRPRTRHRTGAERRQSEQVGRHRLRGQERGVTQHARGGHGIGFGHEASAGNRPQPSSGHQRLHGRLVHVRGPRDLVERVHLGRPCEHRREEEGKTLASLGPAVCGQKAEWLLASSKAPST